jgi:hypothetical protein
VFIQAFLTSGNFTFSGTLNCLNVSGNSAILAATGTWQPGGLAQTVYARVSPSRAEYRRGDPDPNPTCALFLASDDVLVGTFTIVDSQPPPPPT